MNFSYVDEGYEVMAKVKTLFNVVVCGIVIGTMFSNFVLKEVLHVHPTVEMVEDAILN